MANGSVGDGFEPGQRMDKLRPRQPHRIEQPSTPASTIVFRRTRRSRGAHRAGCGGDAYGEWGGGASNDDSYNLEAFVAAEVTLAVTSPNSWRWPSPRRRSA